ncbi:hypothetical protein AVEN_206951-1 [Araneus ventricosus]|uniref:Uncharacterized protein n=1 Tax=Araneus ventricosus TaxID=182803 RepID=A0A4Y2L6T7_ARAVE|nr:hypothetical protein AVEN_206951-1 [Araneus ventricosus]
MKYSGSETTFLAYCTFVRVAANPISGTKEQQARLFTVSISSPPPLWTHGLVSTKEGEGLSGQTTLGAITCFLCHFSLIAYHSVKFAVTMANVGKRII